MGNPVLNPYLNNKKVFLVSCLFILQKKYLILAELHYDTKKNDDL